TGAEVGEDVHHEGVVFAEQAEQEVLGAHVLVVAPVGLFTRFDQRGTYAICEIVGWHLGPRRGQRFRSDATTASVEGIISAAALLFCGIFNTKVGSLQTDSWQSRVGLRAS